jgi:hypothetical protein
MQENFVNFVNKGWSDLYCQKNRSGYATDKWEWNLLRRTVATDKSGYATDLLIKVGAICIVKKIGVDMQQINGSGIC